MCNKHLHETSKLRVGSEIYVRCGTKTLLFFRSATAPMFPNCWMGPGGHVAEEEDFLKTALREIQEETGVSVLPKEVKLKAITIHRRPNKQESIILPVFLAVIDSIQNTKPSDEGNAHWIDMSEVFCMNNIYPSARYYLDHVLYDKPGVLYTNLVWNADTLEKESSVTLGI